MTYRVDSDIYYPYDTFIPCNGECQVDEYWSEKEVLENVRRKTKFVMQALSDCETPSKRENLVSELSKLIKVDLYGKCNGTSLCDYEYCFKQELENHMFYLAFENSVCKDYITEKFWYLKHLIVPIVLSRRVFKQTKIPDNVYIAVDDFNNITELANYLLYLQRNKTEYLKYFEWTKTYRKTTYRLSFNKLGIQYNQGYINAQNNTFGSSYNTLCNLCELAHKQYKNGHPRHIIRDIWKYWKSPNICIENWADIWLKGRHKEVYEKANWQ
uniref:Fucosyltransferase n=1 Tax=Meloidogyne hapla TaxID=6305 RepID=A0A1I8AZS9_MELHA